jgi:uncharacterized membrane protein YbhN (UPF0104 family)
VKELGETVIELAEIKTANGLRQDDANDSTAATPVLRRHPYSGFAVRAGLGAGVIAFLLWRYDARPVLRLLGRERPLYFVATILLYVAGQALSAYRWQLLTALLAVRGRFIDFLAYYFVGMFTNLFVPGLVGGDAARVVYLGARQNSIAKAITSVIADRGVGVAGLCWFAAASALLLNGAGLPPTVIRATIAIGFLTLLCYLGAPLLARLIRLMRGRVRGTAELLSPYLRRPLTLLPAIGLSITLHASQAVCQYLLAVGLGLKIPLTTFMLCVPITNVFATLPITLNGLGVRETAYIVLFGFAGVGRVDAIAMGLLWFASTMIGGLTGALAFVMTDTPVLRETRRGAPQPRATNSHDPG